MRRSRLAAPLGCLLVASMLAACTVPRRLVYPAPWPPRAPAVAGGETWRVPVADAADAVGFFVPPPAGAPVVVVFHGNGMQIASLSPLLEKFRDRGLGSLAIEFPGYGLAGGVPSEAGIYAASVALLDALDRRGVDASRVTLMGISIGTGVAAEMALRHRGAKLVLSSPFTSLPAVGRRFAPFFPASAYTEKYETERKAPAIAVPTLLVHGTDDTLIPAESSIVLARAFPCAVPLWVVGADHNDVFAGARGERVIDEIARFALLPDDPCAQK